MSSLKVALWWLIMLVALIGMLSTMGCSDHHPTASTTRVCTDQPVGATVASECH